MKLVITMSRRFGTGASIIAEELSKRLDIPVYDKAYIEEKLSDHKYESEAEAIRKLAENPCIILGRCASDILKDRMNVLNIYVSAAKEDRIQRIMKKENLDHDAAKEKVEHTDEERAAMEKVLGKRGESKKAPAPEVEPEEKDLPASSDEVSEDFNYASAKKNGSFTENDEIYALYELLKATRDFNEDDDSDD